MMKFKNEFVIFPVYCNKGEKILTELRYFLIKIAMFKIYIQLIEALTLKSATINL